VQKRFSKSQLATRLTIENGHSDDFLEILADVGREFAREEETKHNCADRNS